MDYFNYTNDVYHAESVPLDAIAHAYGTPTFVYSKATLKRHFDAFSHALGTRRHQICYAVKANSNLAILSYLDHLGAGFDIVSGGELSRVLAANIDPQKVVFSGVGKTEAELSFALTSGIGCFNIESVFELELLEQVAQSLNKIARVSVRVNPDVDPKTHPYISTGLKENKFGVDMDAARGLYDRIAKHPMLEAIGVDCHIGSQITELSPFTDALDRVLALYDELIDNGHALTHIDVGGGLGIPYRDETPPSPAALASALEQKLGSRDCALYLEPGRAIVGNAGILLTRVIGTKSQHGKHFAIVDAAMNDLLRPTLYQAWHDILPVKRTNNPRTVFDIVGPICETGDTLGLERELAITPGDTLAIRSAGAYGFAMSSNYNSRPRAAEVIVDGHEHALIREREDVSALFSLERIPVGLW